MARYIHILLLLLGVGCSNRFDRASSEGEEIAIQPANISISELHSITSTNDTVTVLNGLIISGSVTANDDGGNFYHSFIIEQDGAAIEILEGRTNNASRYPEGVVVTVALKDLSLARSSGVLQVGFEAGDDSSYALNYLYHSAIIDYHISVSTTFVEVEPYPINLTELATDVDLSDLCGRLVSIEGVTLESDDEKTLWSGSHTFVDDDGNTLQCYTNSYCDYATEQIPTSRAKITGILQSYSSSISIKMRTLSDYVVL